MSKTKENHVVKRLVRIPRAIDKQLKKRAAENNRSVNGQIVEELEMNGIPRDGYTTSSGHETVTIKV